MTERAMADRLRALRGCDEAGMHAGIERLIGELDGIRFIGTVAAGEFSVRPLPRKRYGLALERKRVREK